MDHRPFFTLQAPHHGSIIAGVQFARAHGHDFTASGAGQMKRRVSLYEIFDRLLVLVLGAVIVGVVALLAISVARSPAATIDLQEGVDDLAEAAAELQEAVDILRANTDDPAVASDLGAIEQQLDIVDRQLEILQQQVDSPALEAIVVVEDEPQILPEEVEAIQKDFSQTVTVASWLIGSLSIVTAVALAIVLNERRRRRRRLSRPPSTSSMAAGDAGAPPFRQDMSD